jgi:hypothetical protein
MHGRPVAVQLKPDIKQGPGVRTTTGPGVGGRQTKRGCPIAA